MVKTKHRTYSQILSDIDAHRAKVAAMAAVEGTPLEPVAKVIGTLTRTRKAEGVSSEQREAIDAAIETLESILPIAD